MGIVVVFFKLDINLFLNLLQAQYRLSLVRDLVSLSALRVQTLKSSSPGKYLRQNLQFHFSSFNQTSEKLQHKQFYICSYLHLMFSLPWASVN